MPTRREEGKRLSRTLGVPVVTPTHPKRGFLKRTLDAPSQKARERHYKNETRKRGGLKKR